MVAAQRYPLFSVHLPLLLFLSITLKTLISNAADTISVTHSLSGNQTIISSNGYFALGFFQPSLHTFYIGIWYYKIPQFTTVWVANRESPISDPTASVLRISDNGNLILLDQSQKLVWSTNASSIARNTTVATILDSGNLVLRDVSDSDPSKVLWQSFDHPTDTLLPGAQLGLNKVTGEYQQLTAWKNTDDPSPGIFSLSIDPNGSDQFFLFWNRSQTYWTTGLWDSNWHFFSGVQGMLGKDGVTGSTFAYFSNSTTNYFTYTVPDKSIAMRKTLGLSGQVMVFVWTEMLKSWVIFWSNPNQPCDVYALCGPFSSCDQTSTSFCTCLRGFREASPMDWRLNDWSKGCVRNTVLKCGADKGTYRDRFLVMPVARLPDTPTQALETQSVGDCEMACLSNCSCTAFSYSSSKCSLWHGEMLNLQQSSGGSNRDTLHLRLDPSELPSSKAKKGLAVRTISGAVVGFLACLAAACTVVYLVWRGCLRPGLSKTNDIIGGLVSFRYFDLKQMTNNFSEKLGGGAFGSVFKGMLPDSTVIAVKKLDCPIQYGEKQFRAEVSTIGTIQHVNLVHLHGFCSEGTKKLLVYEYMVRGSLDRHLFRSDQMVLGWNTRYQIALGAARGLTYLHEKCRDCIIHCDVKPENILLDESYNPKVADFGMAKLVGRDFSRVLTTIRGTIGYLAPEWVYGTTITAKADVYSYGMMLLEIISGRRNTKQVEEERVVYFPMLAASRVLEGDALSLLDHQLEGNANLEELERACRVACWCIQDDEMDRPSMGRVVQILEGIVEVSSPPIPRSFHLLAENPESMVFF